MNPPSAEDLVHLYNGYGAVAERVDKERLRALHIPTKLDNKIVEWLQRGADVILTGNPGDGKTHLINYLNPTGVTVERDASQKEAHQVLEKWRESRELGQPFFLAINHAPLRELASLAKKTLEFKVLYDMVMNAERPHSSIDNCIIYNESQTPFSQEIYIIDLSQREVLTTDIITSLLDKMCTWASNTSCEASLPEGCSRCPIKYNATALSNTTVRRNLTALLSLVARRGFHATMRDLVGTLAYILTGGVHCDELWEQDEEGNIPPCYHYDYYNLLYHGGRNHLFIALREMFDPGSFSDPRIDMKLWTGTLQREPIVEGEFLLQPKNIEELKVLKRRYFLEDAEPPEAKLTRMLSPVEHSFDQIVSGDLDPHYAIENIIEMINSLYAPVREHRSTQFSPRHRLYLWNSHRYAVGKPRGYVSMRAVNANALQLYFPKLNPKYEGALDVQHDHVLLGVQDWLPGDAALRVDWEMYSALAEAREGRPIDSLPYDILRRLDLFLRSLGSEVGPTYFVETIVWSDYDKRKIVPVQVNRKTLTYQPSE